MILTVAVVLGLVVGVALGALLLSDLRGRGGSGRAMPAADWPSFVWRPAADRLEVSPGMAEMIGALPGAAPAEVVAQAFAPDHRQRLRSALAQAAETGELRFAAPLHRRDAAPVWIALSGRGEDRDQRGRFTRLAGLASDVTEERLASLRARAAEARLIDAVAAIPDAFVLFDHTGLLVQCNTPFRELFGIEPKVVKPGARRAYVLQFVRLALAEPAPEGPLEGERALLDGRFVRFAERRTTEGGWVITAADVSLARRQAEARQRHEEELERLVASLEASRAEAAELAERWQAEKARAEAANAAKSAFLANMSHELRTPLNAINGFSEMMVEEMCGPLDPRYRQYAADILASGEHLLALINDVLDLAKIEAGKMRLSTEPLALNEVARDALRIVRRQARTAGVEIVFDLAPAPAVEADYRLIKQVLLNLFANAIKHTPRGGKVRLAAEADRGAGQVRVSVVDDGPGVAPADLDRLARPFEQAGPAGGGAGLGLALCRSLIELHGGALALENAPGAGLAVRFTLPVASASDREHGEQAA